MYLIFITIGLVIVYLVLFFIFPFFFKNNVAKLNAQSLPSLIIIVAVSLITYIIALYIPDKWLSNRIVHIMGGGFVSFLTCFLVTKNTALNINKFQFFLFSFLVVTALGVGNEIIEFFLQYYFNLEFAPTVNDTWLDLISNTIGALIAAAIFVPFIRPDRNSSNGH